jgi:hypothetical protein
MKIDSMTDVKDFAFELYKFNTNFVAFEINLYSALAGILSDDGSLTEIILGQTDSISKKLEIIIRIAKIKKEYPAADLIIAMGDKIKEIVKIRNILAHGLQKFSDDGTELHFLVNAFRSDSQKPKEWNISLDTLRSLTSSLALLSQAFEKFVPINLDLKNRSIKVEGKLTT